MTPELEDISIIIISQLATLIKSQFYLIIKTNLLQVRHFYKKLYFNPGHNSDPKEKVI